MKPGTAVRIESKCIANGRTGTVTKTAPFWAALKWARVELDPPGLISWSIFPPGELREFKRPAPPQGDLFGEAA